MKSPWWTVVLGVAFAFVAVGCKKSPRNELSAQPASETTSFAAPAGAFGAAPAPPGSADSAKRTAPDISPTPVRFAPERSVFVVNKDPRGPKAYIDRPALRSLLVQRRYDKLREAFEKAHDRADADIANEDLAYDAAKAFASPEAAMGIELDLWVAKDPTSFAPYLARAYHRASVGWAKRGAKFARDTEAAELQGMQEAHAKAIEDAEKALSLRKNLPAAYEVLLMIGRTGANRAATATAYERAKKDNPLSYWAARSRLYQLEPKWGGSYPEMLRSLAGLPYAKNPRLHALEGIVDLTRADEVKGPDRLALLDKAAAKGLVEALVDRADYLQRESQYDKALVDLDVALAKRPTHVQALAIRARIFAKQGRWSEAGDDMLLAARITPDDTFVVWSAAWITESLVYYGFKEREAGRRDSALHMLETARSLNPNNRDALQQWFNALVRTPDYTAHVPELEKAAAAAPDDYNAHAELDFALTRNRKLERAAEMWTAFLEKHPEEGRAWIDRYGTYASLGRLAEAREDLRRACEVGDPEGCLLFRAMPAPGSHPPGAASAPGAVPSGK